MAIMLKVNRGRCDKEKLLTVRDNFYYALVGSPAYVNCEIAIVEEDNDSFTLCVGENNDHNIRYGIKLNELEDTDSIRIK